MKICKYAGDKEDNYCVSCDGIKMLVDGVEMSCAKCAGYEAGTEEVDSEEETKEKEVMNEPVENTDSEQTTKNVSNSKETKSNNKTTTKETKSKNNTKSNVKEVVETVKEAHEETVSTFDGIKVVSLSYTSGATIKKNDDFFKFVATETWDTSCYNGDIQDARDILWEKLNTEIDSQIEQLLK